jgi:hypothetical protein
MMRKKYLINLLPLALVAFFILGLSNVTARNNKIQLKDVQLQSRSAQLKKLNLDYKELNTNLDIELKQKVQNTEHIKQLEQEKQQLEQKTKEQEQQLQAKAAEKERLAKLQTSQVVYAAAAPTPVAAAVAGCGDNTYANYIYMHESGCRPAAVNSIGCRGIGQACPGGKLPCGADYACQNAYFSNYAIQRYGSWANAYNFWLGHKWW